MDAMEQVITRWTNAEEIRLRAGEIDAETMRTVLAVTKGMARDVEDVHLDECEKAYESGYDNGRRDELEYG